jgi:hypothetical protein
MSTPADAIRRYILAKDGNRPFLLKRAFAEDAELEMVVNTDAISFPSSAKGLRAIEDVVVRRFAVDYENIYTFCLSQPSEINRRHFPCYWLVGMSTKNGGQISVGCGRYDWYFEAGTECRVEKLVIAIDVMKIFPAADLVACMNWLTRLPYPWCAPEEAIGALPTIEGLAEIEAYLKAVRPILPER